MGGAATTYRSACTIDLSETAASQATADVVAGPGIAARRTTTGAPTYRSDRGRGHRVNVRCVTPLGVETASIA